MATTTFRRDHLLRPIVDPTTTAKDHIGRLTTATVDYIGRPLGAVLYTISTAYTLGQLVAHPTGPVMQVTVAGTSAATTPTLPGFGLTVVSGTVTFLQITTT